MKMFLGEISIWISRCSKAQGGQTSSNPSSARQYVLSCFSCVWLFAMLWTVAHQFPLSMGFYKQEYWSGLPCALLGDLPHPGIETMHWQAGSLPLTSPVNPTKRQREKANSLFLSGAVISTSFCPQMSKLLFLRPLGSGICTNGLQVLRRGVTPLSLLVLRPPNSVWVIPLALLVC